MHFTHTGIKAARLSGTKAIWILQPVRAISHPRSYAPVHPQPHPLHCRVLTRPEGGQI